MHTACAVVQSLPDPLADCPPPWPLGPSPLLDGRKSAASTGPRQRVRKHLSRKTGYPRSGKLPAPSRHRFPSRPKTMHGSRHSRVHSVLGYHAVVGYRGTLGGALRVHSVGDLCALDAKGAVADLNLAPISIPVRHISSVQHAPCSMQPCSMQRAKMQTCLRHRAPWYSQGHSRVSQGTQGHAEYCRGTPGYSQGTPGVLNCSAGVRRQERMQLDPPASPIGKSFKDYTLAKGHR